jgi:hypothetical protein
MSKELFTSERERLMIIDTAKKEIEFNNRQIELHGIPTSRQQLSTRDTGKRFIPRIKD